MRTKPYLVGHQIVELPEEEPNPTLEERIERIERILFKDYEERVLQECENLRWEA